MATPMTVAQLEKHPEYPYVVWDLKPDRKGRLDVAKGRGGPFKIAWELHGHGPTHILLVMGLGGLKSAWQRQTKDFGHTQADKYSVLIVDNRGIGESDKPLMRYSTSEMARDMIELLDHVGWTATRDVNIVGISMGGMIGQEMGLLIPERIQSLTLVSTAARLVNTIGFFENLRNRINLFIPKSLDEQIAHSKHMIYTQAYLSSADTLEYTKEPFPTSGDRFGAAELCKRRDTKAFTRAGFMAQALAAGWHHKSAAQLKELGDKVGRERMCVIHGGVDRMITVPHGEVLVKELNDEKKGPVRKAFWSDIGHIIPIERREEFNRVIQEVIEKAQSL